MKKRIILGGAVLTALLLLVFCTKVEFDNPLDEKGTNFLYGDTSDRAEKIAADPNGTSGLFDSTKNFCDGTPPQLTLAGPTSVTIKSNEPAELTKFMGKSDNGWNGVVNLSGEGIVEASLTIGGVTPVKWDPGNVPAPGQYLIVYKATKNACKGKVPTTEVQRGLIVLEYIPPNETPPIVKTQGQNPFPVDIGKDYVDPGVYATEGDGVTAIQLDSITVTSGAGVSVGINTIKPSPANTQAAIAQLNTQLTAKNGAAGTYTVTYYASSRINGKSASVSRTVEYRPGSSVGLPIPVIVLKKYTHSYGGKTIYHVDTAFATGGSYREIGVEEVYYMKDGVKTTIQYPPENLPTVTGASVHSEKTATYTLQAKPNEYQAANATRYVTIWDGFCDNSGEPSIRWEDGGGDALTLSLSNGGEWNYIASWRVTGNDDMGNKARGYLVDLGGLERKETNGDKSPTNRAMLVPRSAPYTITYVGLGGCGKTAVRTRTLTVTP